MVASKDIKFYVHTNNNAPQLTNSFGCMINVLDACLINGVFIGAISSLTMSGKVATATFNGPHNLLTFQVIKITGANQSELNGEHRITAVVSSDTIMFELSQDSSVTTATGLISASLPPLGWEKPFSSVNVNGGGKAAYRSTDQTLLNKPFLRIVDELDPVYSSTYSKYAKVGIVENLSDIDTFTGAQAPYSAASPDKNWVGSGSGSSAINGWAKWYYSRSAVMSSNSSLDSTVRNVDGPAKYVVVGSGDFFYILNAHHHNDENKLVYGFGALDSENRNAFLSASIFDNTLVGTNIRPAYQTPLTSTIPSLSLVEMIKSFNQEGIRVGGCSTLALPVGTSGATVRSGSSDVFTNIVASPVYCADSNNYFRGKFPSINYLYKNKPYQNLVPFYENGKMYLPVNIYVETTNGQVLMEVG